MDVLKSYIFFAQAMKFHDYSITAAIFAIFHDFPRPWKSIFKFLDFKGLRMLSMYLENVQSEINVHQVHNKCYLYAILIHCKFTNYRSSYKFCLRRPFSTHVYQHPAIATLQEKMIVPHPLIVFISQTLCSRMF